MKNSTEKRDGERIEPPFVPDLRLLIQGVARNLINISDSGFGVLIDTPTDFHLGQRIDDIRFERGDDTSMTGDTVMTEGTMPVLPVDGNAKRTCPQHT